MNTARMKEDYTPGTRDKNNDGETSDKFQADINKDIMDFFVTPGDKVFLDEYGKEVLVENKFINDFLRQIEKLSGPMRVAVAKSPAFSFSTTINNLCHDIHKRLFGYERDKRVS